MMSENAVCTSTSTWCDTQEHSYRFKDSLFPHGSMTSGTEIFKNFRFLKQTGLQRACVNSNIKKNSLKV